MNHHHIAALASAKTAEQRHNTSRALEASDARRSSTPHVNVHRTLRRCSLGVALAAVTVALGGAGIAADADARPKQNPNSAPLCATVGDSATVADMLSGGCPD